MRSSIKSIAVFCGASSGNQSIYMEAAKGFARSLVKHHMTLVYGGGKVGLMGVIADEVLRLGGQAIGVMPSLLIDREIAHNHLTHLHIVDSMHERKLKLLELADAFAMLPGGVGSLDEFFEIVTLSQLGLHTKPYGILNVDNYYQALIDFLDNAVAKGFMNKVYREKIIIETSIDELILELLNENNVMVARSYK